MNAVLSGGEKKDEHPQGRHRLDDNGGYDNGPAREHSATHAATVLDGLPSRDRQSEVRWPRPRDRRRCSWRRIGKRPGNAVAEDLAVVTSHSSARVTLGRTSRHRARP